MEQKTVEQATKKLTFFSSEHKSTMASLMNQTPLMKHGQGESDQGLERKTENESRVGSR